VTVSLSCGAAPNATVIEEEVMAKYVVLYRASLSAQEQMASGPPDQAQAGMELWMQWAGKAGSAIIDMGSPLQSITTVGTAGLPSIGGFSILEADDADALEHLLDDHPHFHSSGDTGIEVLEYLPIPGM
jgi:hypothetical protein